MSRISPGPVGLALGIFSLLSAGILFRIGLLALVRPRHYLAWKLSVGAREIGHRIAIPCLVLAAASFGLGWMGVPGGALFLAAAGLFCATLPRAFRTAAALQKEFRRSKWGGDPGGPEAFRRREPISVRDLFLGIRVPAAKPETHRYASPGGNDLRLDFFRPLPAREPAPCVLAIHGGGWDGGSREEWSKANAFLASLGYAVASMDYRLAPAFRYPAPLEDARAALAWLKAQAPRLGIDPGRFVLLGRSAGGQIALQAAYSDPDPAVKGVIAFYAPSDMVWGYGVPANPRIIDSCALLERYLGGPEPAMHEAYARASPLEQVAKGAPPTLFLHGVPDELVSIRHTLHIRAKMDALGLDHFEVILPWAPHGYDHFLGGPGSQISLYCVERFLAAVTRD